MGFRAFASLEFYEIVWEGEVLVLLRMFDKIQLWRLPAQSFCLLEVFFFITVSISLCVIYLFEFSDLFWVSFGRLYVSRTLSMSSILSGLLAYNCTSHFLTILCISLASVVISPLQFLILFTWVLSLFSWWVCLKVFESCLFFQGTSSWIHWSLYHFLLT